VEFEFFVAGEKVLPNQTIFEVLRTLENKSRRQKEASMSANISSFLSQLHNNGD
jgi:hypothetical protein